MARSLCAGLFCAALGLATLASAFKARDKNATTSCGRTEHQLQAGGVSRKYSLLVPDALCSGGANSRMRHAPLAIGFPCLGCFDGMPEAPLQAITAAGVVVALPESFQQSWNAEVCCGPALYENIDDAGMVAALLDHLLNSSEIVPGLRLEREAVYAWGWSNGGFMSSHLMKTLPGYFRGVVPVSGHIYDMTGISTPKTVSIHFGKKDESVSYGGCCESNPCCCMIGQLHGQTCHSVEDIFSKWLEINSCSGVSNSWSGLGMDCKQGIGCTRPTQLCTRPEGNHSDSILNDGANIGQFLASDVC